MLAPWGRTPWRPPPLTMSRPKDSGRVNLRSIFHHIQREMLAQMAAADLFEHPTSCGAITEQQWIELFRRYLPERYRASSAFVVDCDGRRSRQIDIVIYDRLYSPLLFSQQYGLHLPAESVYAVFEVKQDLNMRLIRDAGRKAASVRRLRRTSVPVISAAAPCAPRPPQRILAGILALRSGWPTRYHRRLPAALARLGPDESLDLGCALQHGAFEVIPPATAMPADPAAPTRSPRRSRPAPLDVRFSTPEESLIFFMIRLIERLRSLGTAPAADLMAYVRSLQSFADPPLS